MAETEKIIEEYLQFVIDYAPYFYVIPDSGPDEAFGKGVAAAAHAIDFLYEAYNDKRFEDRRSQILDKIIELADFIVSLQCNQQDSYAYGGFKSSEASTYYYSIDAMRVIPALIKAYELVGSQSYLDSALLAGGTFLYNMQRKPSEIGVHDKYYGGFAQAVTEDGSWTAEMYIVDLYGLKAFRRLYELTKDSKYSEMMNDMLAFYRSGIENLYMMFSPEPSGDGNWHRVGIYENSVLDDDFAYALNSLYEYEGWTSTVRNVYARLNASDINSEYPAYNPAICWAGYIDVEAKAPACEYYDTVSAGILWKIRKRHDKISYEFSRKIIEKFYEKFMFWGLKFNDYNPIENKQSVITVSWLGIFLIKYKPINTAFTRILRMLGEKTIFYPLVKEGERTAYGEGIEIEAIIEPLRADEAILEPGYIETDQIKVYVYMPIRNRDQIEWKGHRYEVGPVQEYSFRGETVYRASVCRRVDKS
ncbi:hypothetical protein DRO54_06065 [Candidatus Bathyarchaeota archaeon]|nr:MAG: hypothetical protein DRO54_06065 [Candidatus Bathyarchaeota archaeon]